MYGFKVKESPLYKTSANLFWKCIHFICKWIANMILHSLLRTTLWCWWSKWKENGFRFRVLFASSPFSSSLLKDMRLRKPLKLNQKPKENLIIWKKQNKTKQLLMKRMMKLLFLTYLFIPYSYKLISFAQAFHFAIQGNFRIIWFIHYRHI